MAPPTSELRASILDDHNERLRELEGHYAEVSATMTGQTVKLDGQTVKLDELGESMKTGMEDLGNKIESLVSPISTKIGEVVERIDEHSNQLAELQKSEKFRTRSSRSRQQKIKTVVLALVVAAAGAVGTHIVESAWTHFTPSQAQAAQNK